VITGSSTRAYELAGEFRRRGRTVVLGGPHVTLVPDEAQGHADAICVGYAEDSWPQLLLDFSRGQMKPRYRQEPDFELTNLPFARRKLLDGRDYLTQAVFEATRACAHKCEFCVAPAAWGASSSRSRSRTSWKTFAGLAAARSCSSISISFPIWPTRASCSLR